MTSQITVPLSFTWATWFKNFCANDQDWKMNVQKLFEVSTSKQFMEAYNAMKLPTALPLKTKYYFFKKGIMPEKNDDMNKDAGAWVIAIENKMDNDLNLIWSDLLFNLISDGLKELLSYICGISCFVRKDIHKVLLWTIKTTPSNYKYIMEIGRMLQIIIQNVYKTKFLKYELHEGSPQNFNYVL